MNKKVQQKENRRVIGRRTMVLATGMVLVTSFLSGRLYQLQVAQGNRYKRCLLYTSPSPRDRQKSRMPSSA